MPIEIVDGQEVLKAPYTISDMFDFMIKHISKESLDNLSRIMEIFNEGFKKMKSKLRGLKTNDIVIDNIQVVTEEEYKLIKNQCEIDFEFLQNIIFKDLKDEEDTL